jgi:hypothetical protein
LKYNETTGSEDFKKKYGLMKIQEKINFSPTEYSILTHGIDLTTFGLNLNSPDGIINSFGSPFDDNCKLPY